MVEVHISEMSQVGNKTQQQLFAISQFEPHFFYYHYEGFQWRVEKGTLQNINSLRKKERPKSLKSNIVI